jgi:hypothetical protein
MKAIRFTFDDFDFVVPTFQRTGANRVVRMVNNAVCMSVGSFDKSLNFGIRDCIGHLTPSLQSLPNPSSIAVQVQQLQRILQDIPCAEGLVQGQDRPQVIPLSVGQIVLILQKNISAGFQYLPASGVGLVRQPL